MKTTLRILHLEDDPNDAELIRWTIESEGIPCAITRVDNREDFMAAIAGVAFDLILADFSLANFDGLAALAIARQSCPDVPFILVSGTVGEERAVESIHNGATDYVLKGRLARLASAVRRAMQEVEQRLVARRAENQRQEYSHKLQVLSRRLVEAQEAERRRIARELHDQVGQALTAAQLNLQAMLQLPGSKIMTRRLNETLEVVVSVLDQVRDLSLDLRPSMLDDLGLEPALHWYAKRQALLTGLRCEVVCDPLEQRLDPVIETQCFRLVQEAVTNVVRHAKARQVVVRIQIEQGSLHLRVRDDGAGFDLATVRAQSARGTSLGLSSMEERAGLAGGELEFKSAPGQGTEVHAWFPLKWETKPS